MSRLSYATGGKPVSLIENSTKEDLKISGTGNPHKAVSISNYDVVLEYNDDSSDVLSNVDSKRSRKSSAACSNVDDDNSDLHLHRHSSTSIFGKTTLNLQRQLYTQDRLDSAYPRLPEESRDWCKCTGSDVIRHLTSYIPLISVVKTYNRQDLLYDALAGLSCSFLQMPYGIAMALLASLPTVTGLYTSFFPVLVYVVFGTSRHISMGASAVVALPTAVAVDDQLQAYLQSRGPQAPPMEAEERQAYRAGVATLIALQAGGIMIVLGLLKFGFIASLMGTSFLGGFTFAAAINIVSSQLPKILNIEVKKTDGHFVLIKEYVELLGKLEEANPYDVLIGASTIVVLVVVNYVNEKYQHRLPIPIPIYLLLVVVMTLLSYLFGWKDLGVAVVGNVTSGFAVPALPPTTGFFDILPKSAAIAVMIYALTIAMAKLMSSQHHYHIDNSQELVAYGFCNFIGALFGCFPSVTSPARTLLLDISGSRSTINGVFKAAFIFVCIMWAAPLFHSLPIATMAAMISATVQGLLTQVKQLPRLWRINKPDFFIWVITAATGILLDMTLSIMVGIVVSLLSPVVVNQLAVGVVGGVSRTEDLVVTNGHRKGMSQVHRVKIFYFPAPLYFANADRFKSQFKKQVSLPTSLAVRESVSLRTIGFMVRTMNVFYFYEDCECDSAYHEGRQSRDRSHKQADYDLEAFGGRPIVKKHHSCADTGRISSLPLTDPGPTSTPTDGGRADSLLAAGSEYRKRSAMVRHSSSGVSMYQTPNTVVIDCSGMTYIDLVGVNTLQSLIAKYDHEEVHVYLARCPDYLLGVLQRSRFYNTVPRSRVMLDVNDVIELVKATHTSFLLRPLTTSHPASLCGDDDLDERE